MGRRRTFVLVLLGALAGCGLSDRSSSVMPGVQLTSYTSAYVACHPGDDGNLCKLIANQLTSRGLTAVTGPGSPIQDTAGVLVTYEDVWTWDVTSYLLTLRIDARDPATNLLLATSQVFRSTLVRGSPEDIVQEAVAGLFVPKG